MALIASSRTVRHQAANGRYRAWVTLNAVAAEVLRRSCALTKTTRAVARPSVTLAVSNAPSRFPNPLGTAIHLAD